MNRTTALATRLEDYWRNYRSILRGMSSISPYGAPDLERPQRIGYYPLHTCKADAFEPELARNSR